MNVHLLYENREWKGVKEYYDSKSIVSDLGLENLFRTASRDQEREESNIQTITEADEYLGSTLKRVMTVPLHTPEEIRYRQDILRDCLEHEQFIRELYAGTRDLMIRWEKLGKKEMNKPGVREKSIHLVAEVKVLHLFVETLSALKKLCREYKNKLNSQGLRQFCEEIEACFSDQKEEKLRTVLEDITFSPRGKRNTRWAAETERCSRPDSFWTVRWARASSWRISGWTWWRLSTKDTGESKKKRR